MPSPSGVEAWEFGRFRLDLAQGLLLRDGVPLPATPKVLDLLTVLVRNPGRVLMKSELLEQVWPDTIVDEGSLARTMSRLRGLLESEGDPPLIETLSRRGYRFVGEPRVVAKSASSARTLAVLPLQLIGSTGPDVEYLGTGIADALITRLSRLRSLRVRPTSAVARFAGSIESAASIGRALMVDAVLEGRIQILGTRARVTVQLVRVEGEEPLWAAAFDEVVGDWFALQDSVSQRVARAMTVELTDADSRVLETRQTSSREALERFLKARYFTFRYSPEAMTRSIALYEEAIAFDPAFAGAHAGLAHALLFGAGSFLPAREARERARQHVDRAIELDGTLADAHLADAILRFSLFDPGAEVSIRRAIELAPNNALAHSVRSWQLTARQQFDEAIDEAELAAALDPVSVPITVDRGLPYYFARRWDEALAHFRRGVELDPGFWYPHFNIGAALMMSGRVEEACEAFARAVSCSRGEIAEALAWRAATNAVLGETGAAKDLEKALAEGRIRLSPYEHAALRLSSGDPTGAFELLERALEEQDKWLMWIDVDPRFDSLRGSERFAAIRGRLRLPEPHRSSRDG